MGKMKRPRQKLHAASVKAKLKGSHTEEDENMVDVSQAVPAWQEDPTAGGQRGESLFQNVRISSMHLAQQKLPDFDARSTITSKTFRGQNLKKKEKQKIRHDAWISKIDQIQTAKKKVREKIRKQKTPVVGDLTPIEDALPTLELLLKQSTEARGQRQTTEKSRSIPKEKNRKKHLMDDVALFQKVLQHPVFKENASGAIKEHLKIKLETDRQEEKKQNS
jgi:hypothetical protein